MSCCRGKLMVQLSKDLSQNKPRENDVNVHQTTNQFINILPEIPIFTEDQIQLGSFSTADETGLNLPIQEPLQNMEYNFVETTGFIKLDSNFRIEPVDNSNVGNFDESDEVNENINDIETENEQVITNIIVNNAAEVPETNTIELQTEEDEDLFTITGEPRKRRKINIPFKSREEIKSKDRKRKHPVLAPCERDICKKECHLKITPNRRDDINNQFWSLNWKEQKIFIHNMVSRLEVKRRTTAVVADKEGRQNSFKYYLKDDNGVAKNVCKIFFLTTLGYKKSNDWIIQSVKNTPSNQLTPSSDMRGKQSSVNKISDVEIGQHIESYNPCISHYRREHAPNVRYLPSDITVSDMYKDFKEKFPHIKCSYNVYRLQIKKKRISFTKLGHEECELCEHFKLHNSQHTSDSLQEDCETCNIWSKHINHAKEAREFYRQEAEHDYGDERVSVSADLQKIIMLPRVDCFKKVVFVQRIVAYHESFVPLGKLGKKLHPKPYAVLWHEAISGRNKEDIISAFYSFFLHNRDAPHISIWLDNCAAQNKNWTLFTFLVHIVNSNEISAKKITFNYFEAGHTFMSADSFHHQVELSLKKQKKTYDFNDFVSAVQNANSGRVEVKEMSFKDFYMWKDFTSTHKLNKTSPRPYLSDMVQINAERGKYVLTYKTSFNSDQNQLDFLCKKNMKKLGIPKPSCLSKPCGISSEKRNNILTKLQQVIPENRKQFWQRIPLCD